MKRSLKILMVVADLASERNPSFQPFVKSQIESIESLGHEVKIFKILGPLGWYNYILKMPSLYNFAKSFNPDVVHSHYSYCAFTSLITLKYPQVISFMGDDVIGDHNRDGQITIRSYLHKPIAWIPNKFAKAIIVKSKEMTEFVNHKNIHVIPNGVNFNSFFYYDKYQARKELKLDLDRTYILFPGNIEDPRKRFPLAKQVCNILKDKYKIDNEILHMRTVSQDVLNKYYNAADAMIFTSWSEGSPNVVKEAMATNLPIVSVTVGDTNEIINGTKNSFVGSDDADLLAEALKEILFNKKRSNGKEMIKHLEIGKIAEKIEQIYFDILN